MWSRERRAPGSQVAHPVVADDVDDNDEWDWLCRNTSFKGTRMTTTGATRRWQPNLARSGWARPDPTGSDRGEVMMKTTTSSRQPARQAPDLAPAPGEVVGMAENFGEVSFTRRGWKYRCGELWMASVVAELGEVRVRRDALRVMVGER